MRKISINWKDKRARLYAWVLILSGLVGIGLPLLLIFMPSNINHQVRTLEENSLMQQFIPRYNGNFISAGVVGQGFPPHGVKDIYIHDPYDDSVPESFPRAIDFFIAEREGFPDKIPQAINAIENITGITLSDNMMLLLPRVNYQFRYPWWSRTYGSIMNMTLVNVAICLYKFTDYYQYNMLMIVNSSVFDFTIAAEKFTLVTFQSIGF